LRAEEFVEWDCNKWKQKWLGKKYKGHCCLDQDVDHSYYGVVWANHATWVYWEV
jgi:hypothetical protein